MTDLPPGWEWTTIGEVAETTLGKMLDRTRSNGDAEVPYLRNVNVQWRRFELEDVLTMEISPFQLDQFEVRAHDLMVCEGGDIGRCAIWPGSDKYIAFQKALHRVRCSPRVLPKYLAYTLESYSSTGKLAVFATGSTIKHLPQVQLRRIPIKLPSLSEQHKIVESIDLNLGQVEYGEALLKSALARISSSQHGDAYSRPSDLRRGVLAEGLAGRL